MLGLLTTSVPSAMEAERLFAGSDTLAPVASDFNVRAWSRTVAPDWSWSATSLGLMPTAPENTPDSLLLDCCGTTVRVYGDGRATARCAVCGSIFEWTAYGTGTVYDYRSEPVRTYALEDFNVRGGIAAFRSSERCSWCEEPMSPDSLYLGHVLPDGRILCAPCYLEGDAMRDER